MAKVRVYTIARQLGIANEDLVARLRAMGIQVSNHMSTLTDEEVDRVKAALEEERQASTKEERIGAAVIRRRSSVRRWRPSRVPAPVHRPEPAEKEPQPAQEAGGTVEGLAGNQTQEPSSGEELGGPVPVAAEESVPLAAEEAVASAEAPDAAVDTSDDAARRATEVDEAVGLGQEETASMDEPEEATATASEGVPEMRPQETSEEAPTPAAEPKAGPQPAQQEPEKEEEVKLGPTGRRIELSKLRSAPRVIVTDLGDGRSGYRPRERTVWPDRRGRHTGRGRRRERRTHQRQPARTQITTPAEHKRKIRMQETISLQDLAKQMGIKATEALRKLWAMGMRGVTINTSLDEDTAGVLAAEFGFEVENVAFQEDQLIPVREDKPEELEPRCPVVTIMGHVDHGKTSLLDRIQHTDITAKEAGGITQHIGAYKVKIPAGEIVFVDTPGHEAFTHMRARGAQVTDLVILVVAADDGVMPQTKEAIQHAQNAGVPILVAINKIDKADADPYRVRQELTELGLVPEEWGGDTIMVEVSAVTGQGVDQLLEMVVLQAELLELRANPNKEAVGTVLEAALDRARGPVATLLVQEGTLHAGDMVVAGEHFGRVRAMTDDKGRRISEARPVTPVRIMGLDGVPESGEQFYVLKDEKSARKLVQHRREQRRRQELAESSAASVRLDRIAEMINEGGHHELKVVLKTDVQGTAQAVKDALEKLSTEKVKVEVVLSGVGGITETDVTFAKAAEAIVVGFNVRPAGKATALAEQEQVEIRTYNVIYELLDDIREAMRGLLPKEKREKLLGHAEVRATFNISKVGTVAGCYVQEGRIARNALLRVYRDDVKVYEGRVGSLKRFKEEVREVEKGYECGLAIVGFNDVKVGDIIEAYELKEVPRSL